MGLADDAILNQLQVARSLVKYVRVQDRCFWDLQGFSQVIGQLFYSLAKLYEAVLKYLLLRHQETVVSWLLSSKYNGQRGVNAVNHGSFLILV